ncbi:Integral inner nuclear membrane protein ima1 [Cladobotryum mycophilum]|uniref:Integral inner nuclear membrane protein ima1 n=1 Tax=Cladobotryum mycophilum TaxID=491253 RepID=A0ABR0SZU3_9HYPO
MNGEITDPPAVESSKLSTKQYAVASRAASPALPTDNIFCETCLKNQRLFTASLAQYLPDDPSHPDYADLERKYYRFRKDLEKRYPQVCADCAGKVDSRIRQAGYTAKTDHLRRMMEKSKGRKVQKRMTPLDLANAAGRWLWWGGLLMQMLWHLVNMAHALQQHDQGMYDPDDQSALSMITTWLNRFAASLPPAEDLIQWSITAGFLSGWWNPHFVQVNRGFTRHLLGFTQWYSFQGLIIFLRFLFRAVISMQGGKAQSKPAQLSVHLAMTAIMSFIYSLARGSIRVDTTPLFGPSEKTISAPSSQVPSPARKRVEEPQTLAEALNEALESTGPAYKTPMRNPMTRQDHHLLPSARASNKLFQPLKGDSPISFSNFGISDGPPPTVQQVQYSDEMDWSPIPTHTSSHRAFQQTPTSKPRSFGQSPTQPNTNAFWYKVPAAPVNPAQRLRNPPNAPFLRQKQEPEEDNGPHFRGRRAEQGYGREDTPQENRIDFKPPSFFAPEKPDEANALADFFGQSFSLGQETMESEHGTTQTDDALDTAGQNSYELCTITALFPSWLLMSFTAIPYRKELQLAALGLAGIIALQSIGSASQKRPIYQQQQEQQQQQAASPNLSAYMLSLLSVAELGTICWASWQIWTVENPDPLYGAGTLGLMLLHQAWGYFM